MPQVYGAKPWGCLQGSPKSLSSGRKGTLHRAPILTPTVETSFYCLRAYKEFGFITAGTVPMLGSVPWSCLPPGDVQPRHSLHHRKLALPHPTSMHGAGGLKGFWVLVGFFPPPLMLLKTKGWNPLLPPPIETGQK